MANLAIQDLQHKVNEIAHEVDGLDTREKLDWARARARNDEELYGLFLAIVEEALCKRYSSDLQAAWDKFWQDAKGVE